jgi:hypothetical protein
MYNEREGKQDQKFLFSCQNSLLNCKGFKEASRNFIFFPFLARQPKNKNKNICECTESTDLSFIGPKKISFGEPISLQKTG